MYSNELGLAKFKPDSLINPVNPNVTWSGFYFGSPTKLLCPSQNASLVQDEAKPRHTISEGKTPISYCMGNITLTVDPTKSLNLTATRSLISDSSATKSRDPALFLNSSL